MTARRIGLLLFGVLAGLLAGCFELRQSLVIDGARAEYGAEIRVDARLAALAQRDGRKSFCEEVSVPAEAKARGVEAQVVQRTVQGELICTVSLKGPIEAFLLAMDRKSGSGIGNVSIERVDSRTLRIENLLKPQGRLGSAGSAGSAEQTMVEGLFAGKLISWKVQAPLILESNGVIAADGRSVEWSVPLAEAMKAEQRFHATLRLELTTFERVRLWFVDQWRAVRRVLRELLGG